MKTSLFTVTLFILISTYSTAQKQYERAHRIRKVQMPVEALKLLEDKLENSKRFRFYKEIDTTENRFSSKFKKDRLWYLMNFNETGELITTEIVIKPIDIPSGPLATIKSYLDTTFNNYTIKEIRQQYQTTKTEPLDITLRNTFQNLLLPSLHYYVTIRGRKLEQKISYEILFDADGNYKSSRHSLPPNHDRTLY